ncbi:MAG: hypoxanthine phosphoribosyltransferase [Acidimicrobiales bacterium]
MSTRPTALLSAEEIARIVDRLAGEIDADHADGVMLVGLLKGSVFFCADLIRALKVPCEIDFFALSSYAPGERRVRILKDLSHDVTGKDVVIVADIVDTGLSIGYVVDLVRARGARTAEVCALLDRPGRRIIPVPLRYLGLPVDDDFLVGYGLDYAERYRNVRAVVPVDPSALAADRAGVERALYGGKTAVPVEPDRG